MATFILIHGTFARASDWPALQKGLSETVSDLGECPRFEHVRWTGRNLASARETAAASISELVQRLRSATPDEKLFLIGHSHGGSAIAYFIKRNPEVAKWVSGCAFLSTPFVAIRERLHSNAIWTLVGFVTIVATINASNMLLQSSLVAFAILSTIAITIGLQRVETYMRLGKEQALARQTADISTGNYLFLRCSGDEAAAALSAVQFIAWLGVNVTSRFQAFVAWWRKKTPGVRLLIWACTPPFAVFCITTLHDVHGSLFDPLALISVTGGIVDSVSKGYWAGILVGVLLFVLFASAQIFILLSIGILVLLVTQTVTVWAFGWAQLTVALSIEFAIEPLPFGVHSLTHIDWSPTAGSVDGMVHSWTYAHPVAISHLQAWVRSTIMGGAASQ